MHKANSLTNQTSRQRAYSTRTRQELYEQANSMILADPAIIRYFANIASRKRNNGYISDGTKHHALNSMRILASYLHQEITTHFVTDLIATYQNADKQTRNKFLDTLQDFSNTPKLTAHRLYAIYTKGIFKANRVRLEVFVDNHFSHKTARISEGLLEQILQSLPRQTRLAYELLQYGGERRRALCTTPFNQWKLEEDHWVIYFRSAQVKTRIAHISIIPKKLGDEILAYAKKLKYNSPFPDYRTLFRQTTITIKQQFGAEITAHYFRKRFATIADKTKMSPNDWDYLMGSKMRTGHDADTYQLEDNTRLIQDYAQLLEPALAINATKVTNYSDKDEIKRLNQIIESQQQTIQFLTRQLEQTNLTTKQIIR